MKNFRMVFWVAISLFGLLSIACGNHHIISSLRDENEVLKQQLASLRSEDELEPLTTIGFYPGTYALLRVDPLEDRDLYLNERVSMGHFKIERKTFLSPRKLACMISEGRRDLKNPTAEGQNKK